MNERSKHIVTQVSSDDWFWVYVDGDLIYEGCERLDTEVFTILKSKLDMGVVFQSADIDNDYDLVMAANHNANTLDEFFALGLTKDHFE
jgi:hypothetical protein